MVLYHSPENQIILPFNKLVALYLLWYIPIEKHLYLRLKFTGCLVMEKRIFFYFFLPNMDRAAILYDVISHYVLILFKHLF